MHVSVRANTLRKRVWLVACVCFLLPRTTKRMIEPGPRSAVLRLGTGQWCLCVQSAAGSNTARLHMGRTSSSGLWYLRRPGRNLDVPGALFSLVTGVLYEPYRARIAS